MTYTEPKKFGNRIKRLIGLNLEANDSPNGMNISFGGILSIESFSEEGVNLKLKRGNVIVKGALLNIVVFEKKRVEIEGTITEIYFDYNKKIRRI